MSAIYLKEASLAELLEEISRRFDARGPIAEWAAPVVFAVTAYYGIEPEDLRGRGRHDHLVKLRHLTIALLAQVNVSRTRGEVCAILGLGAEMYQHAMTKTDERMALFPEFRSEVTEVLKIIRSTRDGHGHCRTSPRGTTAPDRVPAQSS